MADRNVRGSVIHGYLKYIRKIWGQEGLGECLRATKVNPKNIKEGKWYDVKNSEEVLIWIGDNKGELYVERCGNHTVKDLGILSYIVRFARIESIIRKAPESYADAFDYGRVEVDINTEDHRAVINMYETHPHKYSCYAWRGCFKGMLDITKTFGTVEEVKCQLKDDDHCEFLMKW